MSSTLIKMSYLVSRWDVALFEEVGYPASKVEIEVAKNEVLSLIEDFIFMNPESEDKPLSILNWKPYVEEHFLYKNALQWKEDLHIDYKMYQDVVQALLDRVGVRYSASTRRTPYISINAITSELGFRLRPFEMLVSGKYTGKDVLENVFTKIASFHEEEFSTMSAGLSFDRSDLKSLIRLQSYQRALHSIQEYAKIRNIELFKGMTTFVLNKRVIKVQDFSNEYHSSFNNQAYKNFAVLFHICSFLGFDPYTFSPLQDADIANGHYRLHHFLSSLFRKMSSNVIDLTMVIDLLHTPSGPYETILQKSTLTKGRTEGEAIIQGLLKTIKDLIYYEDAPGNYIGQINKKIIKQKLIANLGQKEGVKAYISWSSQGNFQNNIDTFNQYRDYALRGDFRGLLMDHYSENWGLRYKDARAFITSSDFAASYNRYITDSEIDIIKLIYHLKGIVRDGTVQTQIKI
jgi:hypothetical protein